jgi:hypothetical protein
MRGELLVQSGIIAVVVYSCASAVSPGGRDPSDANAGGDATGESPGACPAGGIGTPFDPRHATLLDNAVTVYNGHYYSHSVVFIPNGDSSVPPDDVDGNCIYSAVGDGAYDARRSGPMLNAGTVLFSQEANVISESYSDVTMHYFHEGSLISSLFASEAPVTIALMGGPDITTQAATLIMPPAPIDYAFTHPTTISRSLPNVISWTPPVDTSGNLTVMMRIFDPDERRHVICTAPACAGRLTLSPSLVNRYYSNDETVTYEAAFQRRTVVTSGTHHIDLRAESFTGGYISTAM